MARAFLALFLLCTFATAGVIDGQVRFGGVAPKAEAISVDRDPVCSKVFPGGVATEATVVVDSDGGLANAFVVLTSGIDFRSVPRPPTAPVALDQKDCRFLPRVVGVRAGQRLRVGNGDGTLHNVRAKATKNAPFNIGLAPGKHLERIFTVAERMVQLHCHVHHWMTAWVGVIEHPYFAVTDAQGRFRIDNVPPGSYGVEVWHETLGTKQLAAIVDRRGVMEPLRFLYGSEPRRAR